MLICVVEKLVDIEIAEIIITFENNCENLDLVRKTTFQRKQNSYRKKICASGAVITICGVIKISRVSEFIQIKNCILSGIDLLKHKIASDKSTSSGNQYIHCSPFAVNRIASPTWGKLQKGVNNSLIV